ncbi:MAG: YkvA family protein [Casimicrobium sp.]
MSAPSSNPIPLVIPAKDQPLKSQAKWKRAVIAFLAFLYIISPLDLVPDVIPFFGWLDDLGVLAWAARQVFFKKNV